MGSRVEISIPSTSTSSTDPPYTLYNITLRLPVRSFTVSKRYSDFHSLHESLTKNVGSPPPTSLPSKSWFSKTTSNAHLAETRREGLEAYLKAINKSSDSRWRNDPAWRSFLNLPSSSFSSTADRAHGALTGPGGFGGGITDPTLWLDTHRDLKAQLHQARLQLTSRDQAETAQKQHEASANAKSALVKSGGLITALEDGLKAISESSNSGSWGAKTLGDGEIRRRKDLVASARQEKEGLENLMSAMIAKTKLDHTIASVADKSSLLNESSNSKRAGRGGRVLGKETSETRELDNQGVLQLQKQKMQEQDLDVQELTKIVMRQKELSIKINEELVVQNEMLTMVDEDVDRYVLSFDLEVLISDTDPGCKERSTSRANGPTRYHDGAELRLPRSSFISIHIFYYYSSKI